MPITYSGSFGDCSERELKALRAAIDVLLDSYSPVKEVPLKEWSKYVEEKHPGETNVFKERGIPPLNDGKEVKQDELANGPAYLSAAASAPSSTTALAALAAKSFAEIPAAPVALAGAVAVPATSETDAKGLPWDERIHASSKALLTDGTWRYKRNLDENVRISVEAELRAAKAAPMVDVGKVVSVDSQGITEVKHPGVPTPVTLVAPPVEVIHVPTTDTVVTYVADDDGVVTEVVTNEPAVAAFGSVPLPPGATPIPVVPAAPPTPTALPLAPAASPVTLTPLAPAAPPMPTAVPANFTELMPHVTRMRASGKVTTAHIAQICAKLGITALPLLSTRPDLIGAYYAELLAANETGVVANG